MVNAIEVCDMLNTHWEKNAELIPVIHYAQFFLPVF